MNSQRCTLRKLLASFALGLGGAVFLPLSSAIAAPNLVVYPLGWNVLGLDSNNVNVGPNQYLNGARVCNTGNTAATNVEAKFIKDGGTSFITLVGASTLSIPSLPSGATALVPGNTGTTLPSNCYDFYFNISVARNSSAYSDLAISSSRQQFHVEVTSTESPIPISTPNNRELYIEKLISQSRNAVLSISGPSIVFPGQIVTYTVTGKTAPGGYEQLSFVPVLPTFFQLISTSISYTTPTGATNNSIYGDACGWENDYTNTTYYHNNLTCNNPAFPDGYSGGKVGDNFTAVYKIKVLGTGSGNLTNLVYDFSGSSYHYNADLGNGVNSFSVTSTTPSSGIDLNIQKSHSGNFATGIDGQYSLTVTNVGGQTTTGPITVTDTLPSGLTFRSVAGTGWSCTTPAVGSTGTISCTNPGPLAPSSSSLLTLTVRPTTTGTINNTATVATSGDTLASNNSSTDPVTVNNPVELAISKTASPSPLVNPNGTIIYTVTVTNNTNGLVTSATIDDVVDSRVTVTSVSTCTTTGGNGPGSNACTVSRAGNNISGSLTLRENATASFTITGTVSSTAFGTIPNSAIVSPPTGFIDSNTANNTSTANVNVNVPDLTITKTHTGNFTQGQTDTTYTLTATNSGASATTSNITVTDTLPTGIVPITATGTDWTCTITGQTVSCTRTSFTALAAGSSYPVITITVSVANSASNTVINTANVSGGGENNTTNNSASDSTTINTSATPNPIACDGNFYQIRAATGSQLYRIDRSSSPYSQTQIGSITPSITLNALGYNKLDGFMYAIRVTSPNTNHLYRIDQNGAVFLGAVTGLPVLDYNTATFDSAGNFYIKQGTSNNTIYKINVSTLTATTITLNSSINLGDMAFHPTDGAIYGLRDTTLYKIVISGTTGTVTTLGSTNIAGSPAVGSVFFDASGTLYGYENGGTFYLINTTNGNATQVSTAPTTSASDGASCAFTAPERVITTVKSVGTVSKVNSTTFNVPYTIVVTNTGTNTAPNVQVTENLNLTFSTGTPTITVPSAPTVTNGSCTPNTSFNGTTDTKLLTGNNTLAINGTCTIAFTARVVYPNVGAVPTAAQNNTAYASSTFNSPNSGYTFVSGTPVPPPVLLSSAQSTIGVTYPATSNVPNLLLVKRVTAINGVNVTGFQDGVASPTNDPNYVGTKAIDDNNSLWPSPNTTSLRGAIHSSTITPTVQLKPGDDVEYTIYYLNQGGSQANNVSICDFVPAKQTFVATGYNSASMSADSGGLSGGNYGIVIQSANGSAAVKATNAIDGDRAQFYTTGFPASCTATNNGQGAVVVNIGTVPNAASSGTPANSYGFIRFKAKVN